VHAGRLRHVAREHSKAGQVVTSGAVVSRPSQREADAYVRSVAVTHRDDGAIDTMLTLSLRPASQRAMTRAEAAYVRARSGAGSGGLLAGGEPETVAGAPTHLAAAGVDGCCFSLMASHDALPSGLEAVLPRLEGLGVRPPRERLVHHLVGSPWRCPRYRALVSRVRAGRGRVHAWGLSRWSTLRTRGPRPSNLSL
jgi:alkanesulfonate monooxygenase SsuD/methylene tetrahydromethanopterin reductase-like flavin-dependent oxidoreductase (luciferase family)